MSAFLKSLFHSSNKHKKLCEEWTNTREPVTDGITFYVRYLGSSLVEDPKSADSTAAGVKRVIHSAKAGTRRPERVALRVAMEGVRIDSTATGETLMDTSIYKISYCSADSRYEQVLAFVSSSEDDTCECHAFLCSKRKVAEAIAVSIAQAFTMAYECWKLTLEAKRNGQIPYTVEQMASRGGASPSRGSKGRDSRASSPGASPPPSEVSSTSGYQSSSTGGQLLELDFTDGVSDGSLQDQPSGGGPRKQWTSFDDVSDMTNGFERLTLDHVMTCTPWPPSTELAAPPNSGSSLPECRGKTKTDLHSSRLPDANGGRVGTTTSLNGTAPSAISWSPIQIPSKSCWPLSTETVHNQSSGSRLSEAHDYLSSRKPCRNFDTNPINHHDAIFTNKATNMTNKYSSSENIMSNLINETNVQKCGKNKYETRRLNQIKSNFVSGIRPESSQKIGGSFCRARNSIDAAFSNDGGTTVPRGKWESFDSSPPPISSISSTFTFTSSFPPPSSMTTLPLKSPVSPFLSSRPKSPISAFLDSCLTPRPEDDKLDTRFAFIGCLSGEGRIFTNNISETTTDDSFIANYSKKEPDSSQSEDMASSNENSHIFLRTARNEFADSPNSNNVVDPFSPPHRHASTSEAVR